jgi:hypothetical protein
VGCFPEKAKAAEDFSPAALGSAARCRRVKSLYTSKSVHLQVLCLRSQAFQPFIVDLVRAPSPFTARAYHCLGAIGRGTAIAATGLYAIRDARTNDAHFEQEGFRALLRN